MFDPSQNRSTLTTPPLTPDVAPFGEEPFRVNRALIVAPIVGMIALMLTIERYRPIDESSITWYGLVPVFVSILLISHVQKKAKRGEDVRSYFPFTTWLAFVPVIFAVFVLLNGALDYSTAERHHVFVTHKIENHGRSTSYYIEFDSWRPNKTTEKVHVPYGVYRQFQIDDPVIVEVHRGVFGIPWVSGIQKASDVITD